MGKLQGIDRHATVSRHGNFQQGPLECASSNLRIGKGGVSQVTRGICRLGGLHCSGSARAGQGEVSLSGASRDFIAPVTTPGTI
jgi:hypothetical protein